MNNRDWQITDHGICCSARKTAQMLRETVAQLDDAREQIELGNALEAQAILEGIAFDFRLLAAGAEVLVAAFDRSSG